MKLRVKELVTKDNLDAMIALVQSMCWPQAVALHQPDTDHVLQLTNKNRLAAVVKVGWSVERNLMDGDLVMVNRKSDQGPKSSPFRTCVNGITGNNILEVPQTLCQLTDAKQ